MAYMFGNFERLGDLLMRYSVAEERLWSNLRSTGYDSLDEQIGGLRPGELVVLASKYDWMLPAFNLQMIEAVAIRDQNPVLHIRVGHDIRLTVGSWLMRKQLDFAWHQSKCNNQAPDLERMEEIIKAPIYMLDAHGYSMRDLSRSINSFSEGSEQFGLIVVEGIDRLATLRDLPNTPQAARYAFVLSELKDLAKNHACPVVTNCNLQQVFQERDATRVRMDFEQLVHDGALASAADLVLVLETTDCIALGKPVDLHSVYSRHDFLPRIHLRYDYKTDRWLELVANMTQCKNGKIS